MRKHFAKEPHFKDIFLLRQYIKINDKSLFQMFFKFKKTRPGVDKVKPKVWFRYSL